jgi:hypothetical protein
MKVRAKVLRSWASFKRMNVQARDCFKPINYGKKLKRGLMVDEGEKEDNQKPAAKKQLQNNSNVYEGTTTRAKKMKLGIMQTNQRCVRPKNSREASEENKDKEYGWTRGSEKITEA